MSDTTTARDPAAESMDESPGVSAPKPATEPETWGWTRTHRIGLAIMLAAAAAILLVVYLRRPAHRDDPILTTGGGAPADLPGAIDPNTADAASLSRIPGFSEETARAIVSYRDAHAADAPGGIVYRRAEDIEKAVRPRQAGLKQAARTYLVLPDEPPPSKYNLKRAEPVPESPADDAPEE